MLRINLALTNVLEGYQGPDLPQIDQEETCRSYAAEMELRLLEEYPAAELTVTVDHRAFGSSSDVIHADNPATEDEVYHTLARLGEEMLTTCDGWIVYQ